MSLVVRSTFYLVISQEVISPTKLKYMYPVRYILISEALKCDEKCIFIMATMFNWSRILYTHEMCLDHAHLPLPPQFFPYHPQFPPHFMLYLLFLFYKPQIPLSVAYMCMDAGPSPGILVVIQKLYSWQQLTLPSQKPSLANSSSSRGRASYQPPFSMLEFCLL